MVSKQEADYVLKYLCDIYQYMSNNGGFVPNISINDIGKAVTVTMQNEGSGTVMFTAHNRYKFCIANCTGYNDTEVAYYHTARLTPSIAIEIKDYNKKTIIHNSIFVVMNPRQLSDFFKTGKLDFVNCKYLYTVINPEIQEGFIGKFLGQNETDIEKWITSRGINVLNIHEQPGEGGYFAQCSSGGATYVLKVIPVLASKEFGKGLYAKAEK